MFILRLSKPVLVLGLGLFSFSALAVPRIGSNVPVAGSIAAPGASTATFTNPAGLVGNLGARLSLQAGSPDPMADPSYRALLLAGNGSLAVSAGVDYRMSDGAATDRGWAVYGLALDLSVLNLAIGVSGRTGIKEADGTDFNAGLLFRPTQFVTIGATAKGLQGEMDSAGVGIGLALMDGMELVADAAFDHEFKNGEFKPGVRLSNEYAGLSVSYGTGSTAQFSEEVSAGVYFRAGSNSEIELLYNHGGEIPEYYAGLTFGF